MTTEEISRATKENPLWYVTQTGRVIYKVIRVFRATKPTTVSLSSQRVEVGDLIMTIVGGRGSYRTNATCTKIDRVFPNYWAALAEQKRRLR